MLRFIIVEDKNCKKDLEDFIARNKKNIKLNALENKFLERTEHLINLIGRGVKNNKMLISTSDTLNVIDIHTIMRCESSRNYTTLYLNNNKTLVASKTLMDFEQSLKHHDFLRIHKSHLVNVNYIEKYIKTGGGHMLLKNGTQLPVAVRKKEYLFRELEKL
jgi:DNA-binding LytR/AlgR family response regulator